MWLVGSEASNARRREKRAEILGWKYKFTERLRDKEEIRYNKSRMPMLASTHTHTHTRI